MTRLLSEQWVSACVAASAGAATYLTIAQEAAMQLLGVPLPVLLASLTGACGARVFLPPVPFWRAVGSNVFWTVFGVFGGSVLLWIASSWISATPPSGVQSAAALIAAALGQRVAPIIWVNGGEAFKRRLDRLIGGSK